MEGVQCNVSIFAEASTHHIITTGKNNAVPITVLLKVWRNLKLEYYSDGLKKLSGEP